MWGCSRCQCGRTEVPYQTPDSCTWGHERGFSALPGRKPIRTRTAFSLLPKFFSCSFLKYLHQPNHLTPPLISAFPPQEQQYAQWMAACRLGSKGKTLADSSFQSEIESIRSFLLMQKSNPSSHGNTAAGDESINTHSLVSPRYHKKYKAKQVQKRQNTFQHWFFMKLLETPAWLTNPIWKKCIAA